MRRGFAVTGIPPPSRGGAPLHRNLCPDALAGAVPLDAPPAGHRLDDVHTAAARGTRRRGAGCGTRAEVVVYLEAQRVLLCHESHSNRRCSVHDGVGDQLADDESEVIGDVGRDAPLGAGRSDDGTRVRDFTLIRGEVALDRSHGAQPSKPLGG